MSESAPETTPPAPVPSDRFYQQLMTTAAALVTFVTLVYLAERFATILQQLLIAAFLAYLVLPAHRYLVGRGLPWIGAVLLLTAVVVGCFTGLGFLIGGSFGDLKNDLETYQGNLFDVLERATSWIPGIDRSYLDGLLQKEFTSDRVVSLISRGLSTLSSFLSQTFVVLIYFAFILADLANLRTRLERAFEPARSETIQDVVRRINDSISQYIVIKTLMSVLTGLFTTIILFLFGVKFAVLWGLIAFLFNYVPYLGSVVAVALPVLLSIMQGQSLGQTLGIFVLLILAHNSIYLIEPHIQGSRLNLSPLVIILSLAFWGTLWGIIGMILAIPLIVVIKTVLENIPATKPVAVLLSQR